MSEPHSLELSGPAAGQPAPASGLQPPPPPPPRVVFKAVLRKHIFIARRRKRLLTAVWPALLYSGVGAVLYYATNSIPDASKRTLLMAIIVPLYLCFAVSGALQCAIIEIVSEKESKMKIVQEIYGLTPFMYWASWAGYFVLISAVCITVISLMLLAVAPVVSRANPLLFVCILVASYMQQFEFAAIVAVFFDKVQNASAMASFMNLIVAFLAAAMQGWLRGKSKVIWYLAGLLPTINVYNGVAATLWLESLYVCEGGRCHELGLSFDNLWASSLCPVAQDPCPQPVEVFSAGESILMMLFDVALYAFLAWWLDNVWQGEFGTAKPLTFCLDPAFMCPRRRPPAVQGEAHLDVSGRTVAMSIRNLRKAFGRKVAVDDMSLDVYGGEIFALLGHNGAGKTTAINCVVGLTPPTSGDATVNGFDVRTDVEGARRQLSVCPQDNPLYDVFTVRQHLAFFASLRGVSEAALSERIMEVLTALGIPEKVDDLCTSLSGGQKRRLWVATALAGQTPVVFLDEPTSGMDPSSRRELWDLLLRMRAAGRAILFTTHYLEEADVLADRKAVLARGRVQAVGTSRDLKMQFGIGYHLQVELRPAAAEQQLEELQRLITGHVASARDESVAEEERAQAADAARVARFVLPYDQVARFGPLLLELDAKREALLLQDYSLAMTSLEEVFMALGQQAESQAGAEAGQNADFRELAPEPAPEGSPRTEASERRGAKALATVRLKQFDRRSVYSTIILPCIFIVLSFANQSSENQSAGVNAAIYPSMAFSISAISFTMQLLKDKQSKCKYVAIAQGLSVRSYWLGTFTAHYLVSLPVALLMSMLIAYKPPLGVMDDDLPLVFLMTLVYPVSLLAYAYNFSLFFTTVEVAVKVLPLSNLFLGTIPTALVAVLLPMRGTNGVAVAIHAVMSVVNPLYGLPGTIVFLMYTPIPGAGAAFASWGAWPLYGSLLALPLLTANLMWWDARSRTARPGDLQAFGNERKDEDVLAEEGRVERNPIPGPEEAVRYVRLSHTYRTKVRGRWVQTPAVRGISLGVRSGECFGLLGPNGAGKTTTLAVLTGEVRPATAGRLIVCGHDISHPAGLAAAYKTLGVCPQVDPLWDTVTGREHLFFYGRVKGIPESTLYGVASGLLYRLGFDDPDMDKAAGKYSGGMKRKLSLGIALIGHSSLLFLDEPSAAVDAGAKRHLWRVIKLRRRDQTVVLTTHSMEEAEALCDRIAIQVHGQLRCLGSPLQIKNKYGSGYQLELFAVGAGDAVTDFVRTKLTREASLLECHAGRYLFQLPPMGAGSALTLGTVFTELQQNMQAVGITDYSLTQPSLEQVFIRFAREQETEVDTSEVPASAAPATSARDVPLLAA